MLSCYSVRVVATYVMRSAGDRAFANRRRRGVRGTTDARRVVSVIELRRAQSPVKSRPIVATLGLL